MPDALPDFVVGNDDFGKRLADSLDCECIEINEDYYPDGEPAHVVLSDYKLDGRSGIFAPRTRYLQDSDRLAKYLNLIPLVLRNLTNDELYNAASVDLVMPYFELGRQDHNPRTDSSEKVRAKDMGKVVGYKAMAEIYKATGAARVVTFDPHFNRKERYFNVCGLDFIGLSGADALARYFEHKIDEDTIIVSPDMGSGPLAERLRGSLERMTGLDLRSKALKKVRLSESEVELGGYDAQGAGVLMVDDIISTGGTVEKGCRSLLNASYVDVACVHAVLPKVGNDRLTRMLEEGTIREVVATDTIDTIESPYEKTSVIPELKELYERF